MRDGYEVVPYDCRPDAWSHPHRLGVIARRAGLDAPDPRRFRLLEIGCADAAHILPIAARWPDCEIVGVERGERASAAAKAAVEALGLENVRILATDLMELPDDLGDFDYVVAHGLYSWVPPAVRERLLAICGAHLAENGVALVSYNALPGGGLRADLRTLLLEAAPATLEPRERVAAARRSLDTLGELLSGGASGSDDLARMVGALRSAGDSALLHDLLAPINEAFSLASFLQAASAHGLRFVGDPSSLKNGGVQERQVRSTLAERGFRSPVAEGFCDLLRYRGFRRTVLARQERPAAPPDPRAFLAGLHLATELRPIEEVDLDEGTPVVFRDPTGVEVTEHRAVGKAALGVLAATWPATAAWDRLADQALEVLVQADRRPADRPLGEDERVELATKLTLLYDIGVLDVSLGARRLPEQLSARPRVTALAAHELARHGWVSTDAHELLELDPFDRALLPLLDGARSPTQITAALFRMTVDRRLTILDRDGEPVTAPDRLATVVPEIIAGKVRIYAASGLLAPS